MYFKAREERTDMSLQTIEHRETQLSTTVFVRYQLIHKNNPAWEQKC